MPMPKRVPAWKLLVVLLGVIASAVVVFPTGIVTGGLLLFRKRYHVKLECFVSRCVMRCDRREGAKVVL